MKFFGGDSEDGNKSSYHDMRLREVEAREKEAAALMLEAQANSEKVKKETSIISINEKVKILEARKKLIDDGLCTVENIDKYLPFPN